MKPVHNLLSPRILTEGDESYSSVDELKHIISVPTCNNIALTGPFGCGKSSILRTLKQIDKNHKYLNVSLATLDKKQNDIEYSIVQQLIYKADEEKICQSRFKRIHYLKPSKLIWFSIRISLLILAIIITLEPQWLRIKGVCDIYNYLFSTKDGYIINMIADGLCVVYMLYCMFLIVEFLVQKLCNIKLEKVSIKDGSVGFSTEVSIFNKHLDEIIHFFKATDYNVLVFEDLDRIKNYRSLFLKLREINCLINDCEYFQQKNKTIKFVYAIRDELFEGENRTKYFDYIVPAIPIINSINAGDYLIQTYGTNDRDEANNECKFDISSQQYLELGGYIDGMRELNNIVNEFIQYKNQIGENLADYKLFAITVYKNKFPDDYAKLHDKSGVLYKSIESKLKFADIVNQNFVSERLELKKKCLEEKVKICNVRELYIKKFQSVYQVKAFEMEGRRIEIDDVKDDDDAFWCLQNDMIHNIYVTDRYGKEHKQDYDYKFRDLELRVTSDSSYAEWISEYEDNINDYVSRISILEHNINTNLRCSLSTIIKQIKKGEDALNVIIPAYKTVNGVKDESLTSEALQMCKMILFLLRNDYIDERYSSFISYFYPGMLFAEDNDYLQSLMLGIAKGYEYELKDPNAVITRMQLEYFNTSIVLNYRLLDELMQSKDEDNVFLKCFVERVKENLNFILGYYEKGESVKEFFEYLLLEWKDFLSVAFDENNAKYKEMFLVIFYQYCRSPLVFWNNKEQLANTYVIMINHLSILDKEVVKNIISILRISYKRLIVNNNPDAEEVYQYVLLNNKFEINYFNLRLIFGEEFDNHAYTSIITYDNNQVAKYINDNILKTVNTFPETSTGESKEAIVELLNNETLPIEIKTTYIDKQKLIIDDLKGVKSEYLPILLTTDHIKAKWSNIIECFDVNKHKLTDKLFSFIERNALILQNEQVVYEKIDSNKDLFVNLFSSNILAVETYKLLINQFKDTFSATDILNINDDRIAILITLHKIEYSVERALDIQSKYSILIFAEFIIAEFDSFLSEYNDQLLICNEVGLYILQSSLTLAQKIKYLNDIATFTDTERCAIAYANEICFYYAEAGVNDDSNIYIIKQALNVADSWINKIRVINSINHNRGYNRDNIEYMLQTLGSEYAKINSLRKRPRFYNNSENITLMKFLKAHNCISSYDVDEKQIYVVGRY